MEKIGKEYLSLKSYYILINGKSVLKTWNKLVMRHNIYIQGVSGSMLTTITMSGTYKADI